MATASLATALTSVGRAKNYIQQDADDVLLTFMIEAVSKKIEDWAHRKFVSQSFTGEIYDRPGSSGIIILNQPDVTAISLVALATDSGLRVKYTGSDTNARVEVTDAAVITSSRVGATVTTTTTTFAAQVSTTVMATTIDALSGWDASVLNAFPSAYLVRRGSISAKDQWVDLDVWEWYDGEYQVEYAPGILTFCNGWYSVNWNCNNQCRIDYTAGFTTVPQDVELVALQMFAEAWNRKTQNADIKSESFGDYSITMADIPEVTGDSRWVAQLARYKRIRA